MRSRDLLWIAGAAVVAGGIVMVCTPSTRERIVEIAKSRVGGGEEREYYRSACLPDNYSGEWCGIFALWALHEAGVALDVCWKVGLGFLYLLPQTKTPKPGDIAYKDAPWQHHAIVESRDGNTFTAIDGNGAGGLVTYGPRSVVGYTFYSIEQWV